MVIKLPTVVISLHDSLEIMFVPGSPHVSILQTTAGVWEPCYPSTSCLGVYCSPDWSQLEHVPGSSQAFPQVACPRSTQVLSMANGNGLCTWELHSSEQLCLTFMGKTPTACKRRRRAPQTVSSVCMRRNLLGQAT